MVKADRVFLVGTKAVVNFHYDGYRVTCATCNTVGTVKHNTKEAAIRAATRDSAKACNTCGAK